MYYTIKIYYIYYLVKLLYFQRIHIRRIKGFSRGHDNTWTALKKRKRGLYLILMRQGENSFLEEKNVLKYFSFNQKNK